MSRGRMKPSLYSLPTEQPTTDDLKNIRDEILKSSDRNAVILASSNLEWQLGRLILHKLPNATPENPGKLLDRDGSLSGVFAKNHLGFALGLYDKDTLYDLEVIRRIRNAYAHTPRPITFRNRLLADECNKLKLKKQPEYQRVIKNYGKNPSIAMRWIFLYACADLTMMFLNQTLKLVRAERRRLSYKRKKLERAEALLD